MKVENVLTNTLLRYRYCALFVDIKDLSRKQRKHQVSCVYAKKDFMETCVNMVNLTTFLNEAAPILHAFTISTFYHTTTTIITTVYYSMSSSIA